MTFDDPFESPKLLIDGARNDIKSLDSETRTFLDGCFAIPVAKVDRKASENVIKYRVAQKIPGRFRMLASNALNNLRHTLDQAVNSANIELGATKRSNYFPFAKDATEIDKAIRERCRTVHVGLIPVLKGLKPYGGGDDLLYALNRLAGPNKHQLVLNMNLDLPHLILNDVVGEFTGPAKVGYLGWDGAKQELELARIGLGGQIKCSPKAKLPLLISIRDSQTSSGQPAAAFLDTLAGKVEGILRTIEAETVRLRAGTH